MFRKATELMGYAIHATDGEVGSVETVLFDDEQWTVRYFVVDTGRWLPGREVLISPISVAGASWTERAINVSLTRDEVKGSPDINTHRPVSRQYEVDYFRYYGYPYYWGGAGLWGAVAYAPSLANAQMAREVAEAERTRQLQHPEDSHLRDASVVKGYHIQATDGEIGHVDDFLIDDATWAIRYLVVDTSNWLGGRPVLVAPAWVTSVSWGETLVHVGLTRDRVRNSPDYDRFADVSREYERGLHTHYGLAPYWAQEPGSMARLEDLTDLEVATEDPDVRGWTAVAADGTAFGTVEHLIVDPSAMKVRYLEVGLEGVPERARHEILVPIEQVELDEALKEVRLATVPWGRIGDLPAFTGLPLDADDERRLQAGFGTTASGAGPHREVRVGRRLSTEPRATGQAADRPRPRQPGRGRT